MAEDETTEPAEPDGTEAHRLDRLESKVDHLADLVAKVLPTHAEAEQQQEKHLDRPTDLTEAVQAELDARDRRAAEQAAADTEKSERESIKEQLARLQERPPVAERSPLAKFVTAGWGDGRA